MTSIVVKYSIFVLSVILFTSCSLYQTQLSYSFAPKEEFEIISADGKRSLFWTEADTGLSMAFPLQEYENVQYRGKMQNSSIRWMNRVVADYRLKPGKVLYCIPETLFAFVQSGELDDPYNYKPNCVVKRGKYSNYADAVSFYAPEVYPIEKDDILRCIDLDTQKKRLVIIDRFSMTENRLLVIVYVLPDPSPKTDFPITIQKAIETFTPITLKIAYFNSRGLQ